MRRTLPPVVRSLALVAESLDAVPAALVVRHLLAAVRVILSPVMRAEDLHLRSEPEEIALAVDHSRLDRGPHIVGKQSQNLGVEDLAELACLPAARVRVVVIHGVGIAQAVFEHEHDITVKGLVLLNDDQGDRLTGLELVVNLVADLEVLRRLAQVGPLLDLRPSDEFLDLRDYADRAGLVRLQEGLSAMRAILIHDSYSPFW